MQGFTGGVLIPMAFTLIITLLPKAKQPIGLALFALSATFAPAIGPTIGGYLTENCGWQYIFYVNVVPGALMIGMLCFSLERQADAARAAARGRLGRHRHHGDRPVARCRPCSRKATRTTGSARPSSSASSVIAAVALTLFVWIELTAKKPLLNLRLLLRRNFGFGVLANFLLGFALYGSVFILPVYLARIQGYNSEQIGMVLAWTGLPQLVLIPLVPRLMKRFDARLVIGVGFALFAASNFMNIYMTADYAGDQLFWPNIVRAIGQALVLTPLSAVATAGIEPENAGSASGTVQHDAQPRRRDRHRGAADLPDQARAVSLQRLIAVGLAVRTGDPHPDRSAHAVFHQSRRHRSRRRRAPRLCRHRQGRAEAGLHPGLQRHLLSARRGADRCADGHAAAQEAGSHRRGRRPLSEGWLEPLRHTRRSHMSNIYQAEATSIGGRTGMAASSDGHLRVKLAVPATLGGPGRRGYQPRAAVCRGIRRMFSVGDPVRCRRGEHCDRR